MLALYSWYRSEANDEINKITLLFMVIIWALRLGSYLFIRVSIKGNGLITTGMTVWIIGFLLESVADRQKFKFRLNPANEGKFMNNNLFRIVRYPNYLGEI